MRLGRAIEGVMCHHGVTHGLWRGRRRSGGGSAGGLPPSHTTWRDGGLGMRITATWLTPLTCQCGHKCGPGFMLTSLTGSVLPHGNVSASPNCSGRRDLFHCRPRFLPLGSWTWPIVISALSPRLPLSFSLVALWHNVCVYVCVSEVESADILTTVAYLCTYDTPPACLGRWLLLCSCENQA